jgi:hypothetical protein
VSATLAQAQTPVTNGFRDFSYGTTVNPNPTGEKPESKLWWNDGTWWGSLFNAAAGEYRIYSFDPQTQSWADTGTTLDTRPTAKADVLWDDGAQRLYVVSHVYSESASSSSSQSLWGKLFRYSYSPATKTYSLDAGFPVDVTRGRSETLTIAKDFTGRLWVTWVESSRVKVNWTLGDDLTWGTPVNIPVSGSSGTTSSDDISGIVALSNGDIGVMWSNQKNKTVHFAVHRAVDAPEIWQPVETVLPGAGCTGSCADDHINIKADQNGRVYAVMKTSLSGSSNPNTIVAVRDGGWTLHTLTVNSVNATRPILVLDEAHGVLHAFYSPTGGGGIYTKSSPLSSISFPSGIGTPFILSSSDTNINDATSLKGSVNGTTGLLVLASDEGTRRYLHNFLWLGPPPPMPPAAPDDLEVEVENGEIEVEWDDNSSDELAFELERSENSGPFTLLATLPANTTEYVDPDVTAGRSYAYRVRATNAVGPSLYSNTATTVVPAPPGQGNIKVISFEGGALVDEATGADAVSGSVTLETTTPLRGAFSARLQTSSTAYLQEVFAAEPDLYLSFYLRLNAIPSSDVQLLRIRNDGSNVGTLLIRSTGQIRLRNNSTTIGSDSAALQAGQVYRIGIHQKARVGGSNNAVLEAFVAVGDDAFPAAFAALTTGSWTSSADEVRLGSNSSTAVNLVLDNVRLDNTTMPAGVFGPEAPSGLTANAPTAAQVNLSWTDQSATETSFRIERAGTNGVFAEIASVGIDVVSFADASVQPGTLYNYRVRGEAGGVFGAYSNVAQVTTPQVPPAAPAGLSANVISSTSVGLTWTDMSANETGFSIERATGGGSFVAIATTGADVTGFTDNTVAAGTAYSYRVLATNTAGSSDPSNTAGVVTPLPVVPPAAPSGLTGSASSGTTVQLVWTDNSATETLFRIERATSGGVFAELATVPADLTIYLDTVAVPGTAYSYRVQAVNGQAVSAYSNVLSVTTPSEAVQGGGDVLKLMTFESGTVTDPGTGADSVSGTVTFETSAPIKGARSARFNGSAYLQENFTATTDFFLTFYLRLVSLPSSDVRVAQIMNNGTTVGGLFVRSTGALRLRVGSTNVDPESLLLAPGQVYRVMLHQRQAEGVTPRVLEAFIAVGDDPFGPAFASTSSPAWSGEADRIRLGGTNGSISAVIDDVRLDAGIPAPPEPPAAPTGLSATAVGSTAVRLTWTDASDFETRVKIERAVSGGGFSELVVLDANVTGYIDLTASPSTSYTYRVLAANDEGESGYSNEAEATTPASSTAPSAPSGLLAAPVSGTQVDITWTNTAANATTVHVERSTNGGAFQEIAVLAGDATSLNDVFASPGTNYIYRVRAANSLFSAYSNEAPATTP